MKKNDVIKAVCNGYTNEGMGVVKIDGFPFFVKNLLEGEEAELVVTMMKKTYGYARVLRLLSMNPARVEPPCPVAKQCGGCQLQLMSYPEQLRFKKQKVQNVMDRIAKLDIQVDDVLGCEVPWHYRNKCQVPVGLEKGKVVTGFYRIHSNTIIDTDRCMIQSERINDVMQKMKVLLMKYQNASVFRHLLIKHAFSTGEVMVVWITKTFPFRQMDAMAKELADSFSFIKSIIVNVNDRTDNVILGDKEYLLYGDAFITDQIQDLSFHISSKSFYQVNPRQTDVLYGKALEYAQLTGNETVIDLYCGVGTISMFLAQKAKQVIGIEIVPQAIMDAKENARGNGIENVTFVCSDAASYASKLSEEGIKPDVIVVDPPRKGLDELTINSMVQMAPDRIVYVSCDPATLARDLHILDDKGYRVERVTPADMFPADHHVETVVRLSRVK